jgi:large subunit ribosomal protein L13
VCNAQLDGRSFIGVKTYTVRKGDIKREWYVVDAQGKTLGRLVPHLDCGDYVIVVNAEKVRVTGKKLDQKFYYRHSGYPGGLKSINLRGQLQKHPTRVLEAAVRGMLPKNRLGRAMIKKLKVYAGDSHPHQAQQPKVLEL